MAMMQSLMRGGSLSSLARSARSSSGSFRASLSRTSFSPSSRIVPTFQPQVRFYCVTTDENLLQVRLSVLGVGGAGTNAVNTMISNEVTDLELFVANTDVQSLQTSLCPEDRQLHIGRELTKGLGAGANPDVGQKAAEADLEEIVKRVGDTNMCFITAGMGGGTGTGAAPVIAKALRDKGILTIGMVCMPFRFEGKRKTALACEGIKRMQSSVDTLIVVQNERLLHTINQNMKDTSKRVSIKNAFKMVDDIFYEGIKAVTDVIIKPGLINLDFADVRTITEGPGWGIMGTGFAEGHGKAEVATTAALNNPLLSDTSKRNATGVLVSITGGPDMAILEVDEILRLIRQEVSNEANVIFGATCDNDMKGAIRVSLILTGPYASEETVVHPMENQANSPQSNRVFPPEFKSNSSSEPRSNTAGSPRNAKVFQVAPATDEPLVGFAPPPPPVEEYNAQQQTPKNNQMPSDIKEHQRHVQQQMQLQFEQQSYQETSRQQMQEHEVDQFSHYSTDAHLQEDASREDSKSAFEQNSSEETPYASSQERYQYPEEQGVPRASTEQPATPPKPDASKTKDSSSTSSWWSTKWY